MEMLSASKISAPVATELITSTLQRRRGLPNQRAKVEEALGCIKTRRYAGGSEPNRAAHSRQRRGLRRSETRQLKQVASGPNRRGTAAAWAIGGQNASILQSTGED